ncbi:hypothetical protein HRbin35_00578 [bacterium HR35]|nr:hypothetical protein HRbin35_00578 [bacterium HR35]
MLIEETVFKFFLDNFSTIKAIIFFASLIYSLNLLLFWLYLEIKNQDEIGFWIGLFEIIKYYRRVKDKKLNYEEVKKVYLENHFNGLIALKKFFLEVIEIFGFQGKDVEEKIKNIPNEDLPNKEDVLKAIKIISLLEKQPRSDLKEEEIELIYSTLEKALYYLNVIEKEDFLVTSRVLL